MKYHINLENFKQHWWRCRSELPLVVSHFDDDMGKKFIAYMREDSNEWSASFYKLFLPLLERKKKKYSIGECDYSLLPFKMTLDDSTPFIIEAQQYGKKVIMFYCDDDDSIIQMPSDIGIIFRTSGYRSKDTGVFGFPTFSVDGFRGVYTTTPSLSFCGCPHTHPVRNEIIDSLKENVISNFILRHKFHADGMDPTQARNDFIFNLEESLYALCVRGEGNYSFRLGEVFMMGRIPVLVDTDCHFPFWNAIPYQTNCVMIKADEHKKGSWAIPEKIMEFHSRHTEEELIQIQKENREIWQKYFTPNGFVDVIDNFLTELK